MTDNARKIFDILGVEPNEKFKVRILDLETDYDPNNYIPLNGVYYIDENLFVHIDGSCKTLPRALRSLLNADVLDIVKLPKEPKKKKLRDWTEKEFKNFCLKYNDNCENCIFGYVDCDSNSRRCWIKNKDLYSDKFLDQEIEVEE